MNKIELLVYNSVHNNPKLKTIIRNAYQSFYDILPSSPNVFASKCLIFENCFYGFHDQNPFSYDGSKLLCNKLTYPEVRMPLVDDSIDIGYWAGNNFCKWVKIADTTAWNFHKGCRLQWINDNEIIYNSYNGQSLCSIIHNINTGVHRTIDYPIDSVNHNGTLATSFSYGRLQQMMPGYGYVINNFDEDVKSLCPRETGIYVIELNTNKKRMIISLSELCALCHTEDMNNAYHFVTHSLFSYDNRYISFLHRWYTANERKTRLIVYDMVEDKFYVSPTDGMVSHYVWNTKNGIIAYCAIANISSHVYFKSPEMLSYNRVAYPTLNSDGHQSFVDEYRFITDTYPDKHRMAKLYLVDIKTNNVNLLAKVSSPKQFQSKSEQQHWCCDLHPRYDSSSGYVCFDSVHTHKRSLCIMNLKDII